MNNHRLSWQTRLLLWLLSTRPDVAAITLSATNDYLERCYAVKQ